MRMPRRATAMIVRQYLWMVMLVMLALIVVAVSIDLIKTQDEIARKAALTGQNAGLLGVHYLSLRIVDIVTRLLPLACVTGVFIAEILRQKRLETAILAMAGKGPTLSLLAVLVMGAMLGPVQAVLEGWARPLAVQTQVKLGLGHYADDMGEPTEGPAWFVAPGAALYGRVVRSDPPRLTDVVLFEGVGGDGVAKITIAEAATALAGQGHWSLDKAQVWQKTEGGMALAETTDRMVIPLLLRATHARYYEIEGFNLPTTALGAVAAHPDLSGYVQAQIGVVRRYTAALLPVVCALLGASLAQLLGLSLRQSALRIVTVAITGHLIIVSIKVFWALGNASVLSPFWATAGSLMIAGAVSGVIQLRLATGPWRK